MKFFRGLRRKDSTRKSSKGSSSSPATSPPSSSSSKQPAPPLLHNESTQSAPARVPAPDPSSQMRPENQRRVVSDRVPLGAREQNIAIERLIKPFEFSEVVDRYPRAFLSPRTEFAAASLHGNRYSGVWAEDASVAAIGREIALPRTTSVRGSRMIGPNGERRAMTFTGPEHPGTPSRRPHSEYYGPNGPQYPFPAMMHGNGSAVQFDGFTGSNSPHLTPELSRHPSPQIPGSENSLTPPLPPNSAPHPVRKQPSQNSLHNPAPIRSRGSQTQLHPQGGFPPNGIPPNGFPPNGPYPPNGPPPLTRRRSNRPPMQQQNSYGNYPPGPPMNYGPPPPHHHPHYMPGGLPPPLRNPSRGPSPHYMGMPPRSASSRHSFRPPSSAPHPPPASSTPSTAHLPTPLPELPEIQQKCINLHLQFIPVKMTNVSCELCLRGARPLSCCSYCHLRLCAECKLLIKTVGDVKGVEELMALLEEEERERREREASASEVSGGSGSEGVDGSAGSSGRSSWVEMEKEKVDVGMVGGAAVPVVV